MFVRPLTKPEKGAGHRNCEYFIIHSSEAPPPFLVLTWVSQMFLSPVVNREKLPTFYRRVLNQNCADLLSFNLG